jgi:hypothetical protein
MVEKKKKGIKNPYKEIKRKMEKGEPIDLEEYGLSETADEEDKKADKAITKYINKYNKEKKTKNKEN